MYERLLNKNEIPTMDDFVTYMGETKPLFEKLNSFLINEYELQTILRFPYGNNYGWGLKYTYNGKLICDLFTENNAFTVMIRLGNRKINSIYQHLSTTTQELFDHKYPCSEGGWIHYRVTRKENIDDLLIIIKSKLSK